MKLKDCTKEELLFVIERLQLYNLSDDYYIQRVLCDVKERRASRKLEEARRLSALFSQKWQEYIDILSVARAVLAVVLMDTAMNATNIIIYIKRLAQGPFTEMGVGLKCLNP